MCRNEVKAVLAGLAILALPAAVVANAATDMGVDQFALALEWEWPGDPSALPDSTMVSSMPTVADLDADGLPDIVFHTWLRFGNLDGVLRAIRGDGSYLLFSIINPAHHTYVRGNIAVGDIDLDGRPEIVAPRAGGYGLIAFEHDGTFKWFSGTSPLVGWGGPSIADLDCDGIPEIILGNTVFDNPGNLRWQGQYGRGSNQVVGFERGPLSCVADLDMDGYPEVVTGNTAYHRDGSVYWYNSSLYDGFPAVGDFDADPFPEIAVTSHRFVRLMEHTGAVIWEQAIPGGTSPYDGIWGSPPVVADFDGDGQLEIGVSGAYQYTVFEATGAILWTHPIRDISSSSAGSCGFDFDEDGSVEIVYGDELYLRVFDGSTGAVLDSVRNTSGTCLELPVVADVDSDGRAEIIVSSSTSIAPHTWGIRVFGDSSGNWANARRIWNQHTYHITNINDDATVPQCETNNWETYNNYRCQAYTPVAPITAIDIKPRSCPNPLNVRSRGVLPVAVLGTAHLDVTDIDVSTVELEGVAPLRWDVEDVAAPFLGELCGCWTEGPDGFDDLTLKFGTQEIVAALGEVEDGDTVVLTLTAELIDGTTIEAQDCVVIIKKGGRSRCAGLRERGDAFGLLQNSPNPVINRTAISFTVPVSGQTTLRVYDVSGRPIATLVDGQLSAGAHKVRWEKGNLASGIYFYRLSSGDLTATKKLVVLE